jgi:hypothetical protein
MILVIRFYYFGKTEKLDHKDHYKKNVCAGARRSLLYIGETKRRAYGSAASDCVRRRQFRQRSSDGRIRSRLAERGTEKHEKGLRRVFVPIALRRSR